MHSYRLPLPVFVVSSEKYHFDESTLRSFYKLKNHQSHRRVTMILLEWLPLTFTRAGRSICFSKPILFTLVSIILPTYHGNPIELTSFAPATAQLSKELHGRLSHR
mmetsp:Transcript_6641/g.16325  ORF Transcript_6641/g.16325 Transcript_6641/m.16325 type:complete len:106 (-) Transcript_6641:8-325(-)